LFSADLTDPMVVRKRDESSTLLAMLLLQHVSQTFELAKDDRLRAVSHFTVGGVGQVIAAWLAGQLAKTPDELIDLLAALLDQLAYPPGARTVTPARQAGGQQRSSPSS
ncbi:MAG: TetR/AcrR family transcriptional regulator, partial [Mycobacteriaceae bacterium]|nr:TetR/AcrR family transcriptional regulator [Mycobacteriaceae bacterium]